MSKSGVSGMSKFMDGANKYVAPVQAATSVIGLGMDIYNTIEAQKQAKEQMELAKKNWNLELEKAQKQEASYNELAGSIDRAWGGSGKVANTIDYSQYRAGTKNFDGTVSYDLGGDSLKGPVGGHTMGPSNTPATASNPPLNNPPANDNGGNFEGSGNTLMSNGVGGILVGHSDSIENPEDEVDS